ncbi:hypothetical protein LTR10_017065 [Elasticomyces elasticus]|uniref:MIND kinetochore complex component Mtw1 n=1 Tax=Exophiala sideris TaxID=1016849 RepID=A0ABR0IZ80_9EURO|nr:hypothetical protein LTR10_017065 [Elasticomyces elasticus]KAK5023073.1 hypothetical protein LTS07_009566 [Exophiala sideris]KAK5026798.1 hypothetical protein LTR13_009838 [Exophiala sideris]KAK5052451.1 hypothetical protein LTR69_009789 [Exophiala sideris]KAK5178236.1 hypothetical protein LTR44_009320 [Eurotiomycetes sp. CCFEE 6388]
MADSSQAATSLLTEHLQYTPLSLIDDIINSVNNFVYQGVGSLETGLLSTPPEKLGFKPVKTHADNGTEEVEYPEAKQEIEEGLHKLETLLNSTVDKNFDRFEIYVLRNILSVPADLVNWVRLGHYKNISFPQPENAATLETVQQLRRKLAASRTVSRTLLEEHNRNEALLSQLRNLVGNAQDGANNLSFLTNSPAAQSLQVTPNPGQQSLTTHTNFVISQLPALRSLLADLRPKLAALKASNTGRGLDSAKEENREERRSYIEQRTRAHLERNGLKPDESSALVSGRRVDPEEVQALERVATIFEQT